MTVRALAMSVLLAIGCQGKGSAAEGPDGDSSAAPRFTGKTIEGEYVALEDYRGKVVLLNVWATWCGPCRQELPELASIQKRYGGDDFTVLGVSIDSERNFNKVKGMAKQYKLNYPIVFDPGQSSVAKFNVSGYPTSVLIGRGGELRWRRNGLIRPRDTDAEAAIKAGIGTP